MGVTAPRFLTVCLLARFVDEFHQRMKFLHHTEHFFNQRASIRMGQF
jgi:hypothetical protein